jgi:hypothetical protein
VTFQTDADSSELCEGIYLLYFMRVIFIRAEFAISGDSRSRARVVVQDLHDSAQIVV